MNSRAVACILMTGLATLACSVFVGGPAYSEPSGLAEFTRSAQDAEAEIDRAIADSAQTGSFKLTLTESQLTAYVATRLRQQPSPLISDPQIVLREGGITMYGKAQAGILVATVGVDAQVTVNEKGTPEILITRAELGPIPMPRGLAAAASGLLQEALTGSVGPAAIGFRLESIGISNGVMTLTGRTK